MDSLTALLRTDGKIWVVVAVVGVVLIGWLYYLLRIGHRIDRARRRLEN